MPPPAALHSIPLISMPHSSVVWSVPASSGVAPVWSLSQSVATPGYPGAGIWSLPQPVSTSWSQGLLGTSQPGGMTSPTAVALSPATEPFPQKLVTKILSGQFVDMRDLLMDNISLLQQLETTGGQPLLALPGVLKPRLREVSTLPTWMYCFLAYVAIRSPDPRTRDMLAYARLVIREAQRHGGSGWIDYDRVFRQQAALDPSLKWNCLHPGIQAATVAGQATGTRMFCTLCREPDHPRDQCALAYLQTQPNAAPALPTPPRPRIQPRGLPNDICMSWNKGSCIYPNTCRYRHICATCSQRHMAKDCHKATVNPVPTQEIRTQARSQSQSHLSN